MKVKVISRNPDDYVRETKLDLHKIKRNYDPALHPLESAREYVRALNATKLDKVFAKPFVGNLDGHRDGIYCFGKHPKRLSILNSGGYDGELRIWDLTSRKCVRNFVAHAGFIRGISYLPSGEKFLTVGDDKTIKFWNSENPDIGEDEQPVNTILSKTIITGISHHREDQLFATCGEVCYIWDATRNDPLKTLKWGVDTLHAISFNQVEKSLLATCASDRSIIFYDTRQSKPLRKIILSMRSNKLAWNPMEAFNFTVANEDYNLYTFDTRQLKNPIKIHYDHVSAVTDIDYSPTGREFVSGSYDRTIRIYEVHKSHSREVYYTKRMQHVVCVGWSFDNKYIYSGSDEMNIRLWKARASEKLGVKAPREVANFNYQNAIKEKYAAHPQIKRIARHRHVPKNIYNAQKTLQAIKNKQKRKEANVRAHSKPGTVPFVPVKNKVVIREDE
ncbi:DDB1- and CUL4-associated factor 13 [Condylostylus longicornis]|uniref:DDB1- and CUL4-associated factor 13 n=1 Tax=Condylostylus longicornis TaxID=2530218 RepID=UPI00244E4C83|nr:DDB1- and CUL4-associated factor 13 [Condylostylus longicornis]